MEVPVLPVNRDITYLGFTTFRDKNTLFGIKRKDRRQHVYILGKSGTGKSVLLFNMIIQNIQNGEGVCVVDPHGELVESVLSAIPPHRLDDVIYFNPADTDYHVGFNVLELIDEKYKHLVASGLMGIFTKIWANAWSARMEYILNNCILALLDTPGTTLLGIPRMLVDKDYRQKIISNLKDPVIKAFWVHEYEAWQDKFRNEAIAPIQNKVGQFLSTSIIRNVVGQSKSTINIFDIMNEGKIFLVNVSKGRIGEDNSALLGGMIITKVQLAAMERVRIPEDDRKDFYLYVDEFQNFVTDAFAGILSEARKYRLNLTVAHQYTAQLVVDKSSAVRDAVFGNVGTMIIFRVGADDADFLEKEFEPEFTPQDIVNLPNYKIYLKLMIDGVSSRPFSAKTLPPLVKPNDKSVEEQVIASSRRLYCRPRDVIELEINNWSGMSLGGENDGNNNSTSSSSEMFSAVCSICGKATKVPFKPDQGRPVYCKECMVKVKSGEVSNGGATTEAKKNNAQFYRPLADLGIEFEDKGDKEVVNNSKPNNPNKKTWEKKDKPRDNTALKEILNKITTEGDASPEAVALGIKPAEKPTPPPISLDTLKSKVKDEVGKDRSAPREEMDKLKDLIEEKTVVEASAPDTLPIVEVEGKVAVEVEQPKSSISSVSMPEAEATPASNSAPVKQKVAEESTPKAQIKKEVPEDVLRKVLEE